MESDNAKQKNLALYNNMFKHFERADIRYDDWLDIYKRAIDKCKTPIIDLGCGFGNDTLYLLEKEKEVIPCDYSQNAIDNLRRVFPEVERAECFDMTQRFPFEDNFTDIVISDLSLHYFTESITHRILDEIKRVLKPNGILLLRINSTKDTLHGAGEGTEIEPHLYENGEGVYKRFFDESDFNKFFGEWERLYLQEELMAKRYNKKKILWNGAFKVRK